MFLHLLKRMDESAGRWDTDSNNFQHLACDVNIHFCFHTYILCLDSAFTLIIACQPISTSAVIPGKVTQCMTPVGCHSVGGLADLKGIASICE